MASGADATTSDKRTYFTFSQPVALPGVTLPAGTYMFRLANPDTSRKVIQVSDKSGTENYAMLHSMPAYRTEAPRDAEIRFLETSASAPRAVDAWWYAGDSTGYQFTYSKQQLAALNAGAQPEPAAAAGEPAPAGEGPVTGSDVIEGPGVPPEAESESEERIAQAPAQQPLPAEQPPAPAQEQRSEARGELPRTASPIPLLLVTGMAAAGLGLRLLRKS
jgi:hypothetical protein